MSGQTLPINVVLWRCTLCWEATFSLAKMLMISFSPTMIPISKNYLALQILSPTSKMPSMTILFMGGMKQSIRRKKERRLLHSTHVRWLLEQRPPYGCGSPTWRFSRPVLLICLSETSMQSLLLASRKPTSTTPRSSQPAWTTISGRCSVKRWQECSGANSSTTILLSSGCRAIPRSPLHRHNGRTGAIAIGNTCIMSA